MIEKLTFEEKGKIEFYKTKWLQIMLSTDEINKNSAVAAINLDSELIGYEKPHIIFCDSPYSAFEKIIEKEVYRLFNKGVEYNLIEKIWDHIGKQMSQEVIQLINQDTIEIETLINGHKRKIFHKIRSQLYERTNHAQKILLTRCNINVNPGYLANLAIKSDFCISVLKCDYNNHLIAKS
jgi:hypothetical protein